MFPPPKCNADWISFTVERAEAILSDVEPWLLDIQNQTALFSFSEIEHLFGSLDFNNANILAQNLQTALEHIESGSEIAFWLDGFCKGDKKNVISINLAVACP